MPHSMIRYTVVPVEGFSPGVHHWPVYAREYDAKVYARKFPGRLRVIRVKLVEVRDGEEDTAAG